ncbi:hypothetical protein [Cytobacillus stercorigallinarum]|uniref:hypothetical protein n=1 Tax=Cytobacillus stercorigallinarum TaxID=2762240 RepID=UPI001CD89226|nr:hypothetical protein [Cytobacillus stercorigallinarum]
MEILPVWTQWISLGLAILGSITGIWALVLNQQRTTITKRIEKERLEAKKKASFQVERTKQMGSKQMQDRLLLHNIGQAEARELKVEFYNYDRFNKGEKRKINPLIDRIPSKINAGQTVNILLSIAGNTAPPYEIIITWDDDFKKGNKLETTLN